ncbi:MAG: FliM/FliN family flagellar motor switch protein [Beijerinckiaceae bacterium]|nr:FliM/FliN family flagellar motor switch protein [Beijerinckiaceae bacterium]
MAAEPILRQLSSMTEDQKLGILDTIELRLTVEAGSSNITIRDLLKLNVGSVIELDTLAGEHLKIRANGTLILKGEVVSISETLGIRVTSIADADERACERG